jgi:two-component system sensor histidine kinase DegS
LYARLKESVSRSEAEFVAKELHDALQQCLVPALLQTGSVRRALQAAARRDEDRDLAVVERAISYSIQEVSDIRQLLSAHVVDDRGLIGAMERFLEIWASDTFDVGRIEVNGDLQGVPLLLQRHLYRLFQSAFGNVVAHAKASIARVYLAIDSETVRLTIEDNGCGFDTYDALHEAQHYGLQGMALRAKALGGTMQLKSARGEGTFVTFLLPRSGDSGEHKGN